MNAIPEKQGVTLSKFLSLVLRHRPESIGITLDEQGWTDVDELLQKAQAAGVPLTIAVLKNIVATNTKKRFSFNETFDKIRANQGHSVAVDLGLTAQQPPEILYHGTSRRAVASILKSGVVKGKRHHVHLSEDIKTARSVGQRHGTPVVFEVRAGQLFRNGALFYLSENGVWLTDQVPAIYLKTVAG